MIGRGTRLCPNLFGPGQHKDHFLVFDFCQNFEFFNQNPNVTDGALGPSLSEKLFIARVELIGEIEDGVQQRAYDDETEGLFELRAAVAARLHEEVAGMSVDNFVVRPKRRHVEKFQDKNAWENLSAEDRAELAHNVAGLPSAYQDDDLAAKQFDYLLLLTQLAVLRADPSFTNLQARIMGIAAQLEELANIPMVAKELTFIAEVQTEEYWQDITLPMLEHLRRRLRLLVKLIEPEERKIVYSDFGDEIGAGSDVALPKGWGYGTDKSRFLMKVRQFLDQHADHITIRKVRRNEQLTPTDLTELERIFVAEGVASEDDLDRIRGEGGIGLFIRSLVGLERGAAKEVLAGFIAGRSLTANQIEFISLIIDHLTENGAMDARRLYESPFTDFDDQGVNGVFSSDDAIVLVALLRDVRSRAAA
jgi:type I restriction enzyme R subunit